MALRHENMVSESGPHIFLHERTKAVLGEIADVAVRDREVVAIGLRLAQDDNGMVRPEPSVATNDIVPSEIVLDNISSIWLITMFPDIVNPEDTVL